MRAAAARFLQHHLAMTTRAPRYLMSLSLGTLAVLSLGCSSSSELRDRGGTVSTPTVITTGMGESMRVDTQTDMSGRSEKLVVSADSAFAVLGRVYGDMGIEVKTMLSRERAIGNPEVVLRRQLKGDRLSRFFECGAGPTGVALADSYEIHMSILSQVVADAAGGSEITSLVNAYARPLTSAGNQVNCATRGELERRIAERVRVATTR